MDLLRGIGYIFVTNGAHDCLGSEIVHRYITPLRAKCFRLEPRRNEGSHGRELYGGVDSGGRWCS
jgi:hypothetical protein